MTFLAIASVFASLATPEAIDTRARELVAQLTLEEKAACACYTQPAGRHVAFVGGGQPGLAQAVSVAVDMREEN